MSKLLRCFPCLFVMAVIVGCHTVPETGRTSLQLIPIGQEMAMGADAFSQIREQEEVSTDPEMTEMVQRMGARIAEQAAEDMPEAEWEFVVFEGDDVVNAFALPGGKVGVYTGLIEVAENEDALAVVVGHEIAHVTARHGTERLSHSLALAGVGVGLGVAMQDQDPGLRDAVMIAYGVGATVGVALPYSRLAEREADEIGLYYAARAGYDPREAVPFWQRMSAASEGRAKPPGFLSTHPTDEDRIARLRDIMPKAMEDYRAARGNAGD